MTSSKSVETRVLDTIKETCGIASAPLDANFTKDLGLDSLDQVELIMALEDEFAIEISDDTAKRITTVREAIQLLTEASKT